VSEFQMIFVNRVGLISFCAYDIGSVWNSLFLSLYKQHMQINKFYVFL
jgi:hypothetical protein